LRNEKVGFKIREHTLQRVPYLLVAGDRESGSNSLAVRTRNGKDLGAMSLDDIAKGLVGEVASRGRNVLEVWLIVAPAAKRIRRNEEITAPQLRIIGADGEQVGVMSRYDALQLALSQELDLVEVSPTAEPPVCRIIDYGKFLFEQNKKAHTAKRKQKQTQVKEVKFRPGTDEGDYQIKLRNLIRFLSEGDKAKVTLRFRGREMAHTDIGRQVLIRLQQDLGAYGLVEQQPLMEGRQMVMMIAPKKK
jgi:translation initiation factor IF-3